jgi:hypothetical protein
MGAGTDSKGFGVWRAPTVILSVTDFRRQSGID